MSRRDTTTLRGSGVQGLTILSAGSREGRESRCDRELCVIADGLVARQRLTPGGRAAHPTVLGDLGGITLALQRARSATRRAGTGAPGLRAARCGPAQRDGPA